MHRSRFIELLESIARCSWLCILYIWWFCTGKANCEACGVQNMLRVELFGTSYTSLMKSLQLYYWHPQENMQLLVFLVDHLLHSRRSSHNRKRQGFINESESKKKIDKISRPSYNCLFDPHQVSIIILGAQCCSLHLKTLIFEQEHYFVKKVTSQLAKWLNHDLLIYSVHKIDYGRVKTQ